MAVHSNNSPFAVLTEALHKRYGKHVALRGIDLAVEPGTVFGVIGPNGAGKTTTIRLLLDLIRPSSGTVRVLGLDPRAGGPALRRRIGYLPGDLRLEHRVTARGLLAHYARISGPVATGAIARLAERLDLDLGREVRTLSKGNKQKLGLVQAFMHEPRLLVLDEPTGGLDPLVQQEFLTMLREAKGKGQTVFLSSHVLSEVQQAADTVAILRAGRVVTVSDVESLRKGAIRHVTAAIIDAGADTIAAGLSSVPGLSDFELRDGAEITLRATVEGDIDAFVKALGRFHVSHLAVEEPDLEESVLALYAEEAGDEA